MKLKRFFYLPSVTNMLFLSLFLYLAFTKGLSMLNDCDTGYHIRAGEWILENQSIPNHDLFSYHSPTLAWTAHEWLSEVIMALIHGAFGLTGVVIFFSAVLALASALLFKMLRQSGGNILVAVFVALLATVSSQIHWLARPHVFSILFFLVWYWILENYRKGTENRLFFLPVLLLIWVNLHGGYLAAFILLFCYILGEIPDWLKRDKTLKIAARRRISALVLVSAICLLVACINPYGFHILVFPFKLVGNIMIMNFVNEFMSPNFHEPTPFKYLLLTLFAVVSLSRERMNSTGLLLLLVFLNMSLYSARYIPLFSIVAAPLISHHLDILIRNTQGRISEKFKTKSQNIASMDASSGFVLWPILAVATVTWLAFSGKIHYEFDPKIKPVAAVRFIETAGFRGNVFNNDEFGDYLIYAAWPRYKVFFDGRSDMYGTEILKEYLKVIGFEDGWKDTLDKYRVEWIFIGADAHLSRILSTQKNWTLVYNDKVAHIYVRNSPGNKQFIDNCRKLVASQVPAAQHENK